MPLKEEDRPEFSVYEFFPDGTHHGAVARGLPLWEAVKLAKRCTEKPAVALGVIVRVIITDGGDLCVFEWKAGEGITYPNMEDRDKTKQTD